MWRLSKKDVEHEIGIPEQTEHVSWLQFTAVEHYFYEKQFGICQKATEDYIKARLDESDLDAKISNINRRTLNLLLAPLLQLRQACCHPAVVRDSYVSMEKNSLTMEQLLEKLISSTTKEAIEAHRKYICALNGLAGVEILMCEVDKAAETYKEAIASWEKNADSVKTDSLQVSIVLKKSICIKDDAVDFLYREYLQPINFI